MAIWSQLGPRVTKRNRGILLSFPQSLEKLGRILGFPFQVGWGSSQFQLHYRTRWRWPISGLHQLVDSQLAVTFQSLLHWVPLSLWKGLSVGWKSPGKWASSWREEEVALGWPRVESPETDSGLASHGSRAHFLFTRGTNPGFPVGLPGHQLGWFAKAEVPSLGFFHALVIFQQEHKGIWFFLYSLAMNYWGSRNWPDSEQLSKYNHTRFIATEVRCLNSFLFGQHKSDFTVFD